MPDAIPFTVDPCTGTVACGGASIPAKLEHGDFLSSELAVHAQPLVMNGIHRSYRLEPRGQVIISVFFTAEVLEAVSIFLRLDGDGTTWEDWSESGELRRKTVHDRALEELLGAQRAFGWGMVSSSYDAKAGESSVWIRYARAEGDRPR